ncbi:MAG: hypothetical protein KAT75_11335, partial [Dehalococcoidia bacterium]|nr:hypothetical protein [Dehalococcoidia bacterium]
MFNKLIIGILVFLLLVTGTLCAYAFNLIEEINVLSQQLTVSQEQQAAQISTLSDELATFRGETIARIDALDDELGSVTTGLEQSVINAGKLYEEV